MKTTQSESSPRQKLRWSAVLLLAGFLLGSLLPSMGGRVEAAPQKANSLDVVINEVAWMGTDASSADEWIELYNPTGNTIDLSGWNLNADDGTPSIALNGSIPAGGYFLLERTDDHTVSDITADLIYTGGMSNSDETLKLYDNSGSGIPIDTANNEGNPPSPSNPWPAGDNGTKSTMERISITLEDDSAWTTNDGLTRNGLDANSNPINGTPTNSGKELIINEVAWSGTVASSDDEWIELYSPSGGNFDLTGWRLVAEDGSPDIILSGETSSDGYFLLERAHSNVVTNVEGFDGGTSNQIYTGALNDAGELLRLRAPNGMIVDTANEENGGTWPAGDISPASMERISMPDVDTSWVTWGTFSNGKDAAGNDINGSPGYPKDTEATPTPTASNTPTSTNTPTTTPTATATATAPASLSILINEVGWAGTSASSTDEWIELYNASSFAVDFDAGWKLISTDGGVDITLTGVIADGDYYLLERKDDNTISDIAADLIYSGSLSNNGEYLKLLAPDGSVVDTANNDGGSWPAGNASPNYGSMERNGVHTDKSSAWFTNTGAVRNGLDAEGNKINGTPKRANWAISVTATASPKPTASSKPTATYFYLAPSATPTSYPFQSIVLNEVLPRPGYDWNGDGVINTNDEFIEIINRGNSDASLNSWKLQITSDNSAYILPNITLKAGGRVAIFGNTSHLRLSDSGDTVRLLKSNNQISDVVTYTIATKADHSWCRFPEHGYWNPDCFPTPHEENTLHGKFSNNPYSIHAACLVPDTVPESITLIECGALGTNIIDADFWNYDTWMIWITERAKHPTWVR